MGSYAEDCLYEVLFSLGAEFYQMLTTNMPFGESLVTAKYIYRAKSTKIDQRVANLI